MIESWKNGSALKTTNLKNTKIILWALFTVTSPSELEMFYIYTGFFGI